MSQSPRVLIVNNDAALRDAVRQLVAATDLPCESFASGREFFERVDIRLPGCAVLALRIADMGGLQIQQKLLAAESPLATIFLSSHATVDAVKRAVKAGAIDFFEVPFSEQDLWEAIQRGIQTSEKRQRHYRRMHDWRIQLQRLSRAERELLELILQGLQSREIAELQAISRRTVEARRARLLKKLNVASTMQLFLSIVELVPTCCADHRDCVHSCSANAIALGCGSNRLPGPPAAPAEHDLGEPALLPASGWHHSLQDTLMHS